MPFCAIAALCTLASAGSMASQPTSTISLRHEVIALTNRERRAQGLSPLKAQSELMEAAQAHAEDMETRAYFSHQTPEGVEFWTRCEKAGYRGQPMGENIAKGARLPAKIVELWMNSPGHRANILNDKVTEIGLGFSPKSSVAVMVLGSTKGAYPLILADDLYETTSREVSVFAGGQGTVTSIRFSEDGATWADWEPFTPNRTYTFTGEGPKRLFAEFKDSQGKVTTGSDSILIAGSAGSEAKTPAAQASVALVFPLLGKVNWSDTFGAPRDGGARKHMGQDLMAEKLRPCLAAFDGVWQGVNLIGDDGKSSAYYHLNNDTPGTDDGKGGDEYMFAPGVWSGVRVVAGQFVAYCGDSGNAENTAPHLHFELNLPEQGTINSAPYLKAAEKLAKPRYVPEHPELVPGDGMVRWDAEVRQVDPARNVAVVDLAATVNHEGKGEGVTRLTRRYIKLEGLDFQVMVGDYLAILGAEPPAGQAMKASGVKLLRNRFDTDRKG